MINPLNELSSVYSNNIAEGCGCDKKDDKVPQGKTPMGGDGARPGKNKKGYVEPMGEGYGVGDVDQKVGAVTAIPKKDQDAARERLLAKTKAKRQKMQKEHFDWRDELREVSGYDVATKENLKTQKAKNSDDSREQIKEKNVKNKIKINPPQGMTEAFEDIGGVIVEMYEIDEKIDLKKADMGEVIKDFRKSDAPQFKGKTKEKKRQMAIAAKLEADEEGGMMGEETEEEKKKEKEKLEQQTRDHDDKRSGKVAESKALEFIKNQYKDSLIKPGSGKKRTPEQQKAEAQRRAKNKAANMKSGPMKYDPYKGTDGRD